jgi:hypothetical protein
MTGIIEVTLNGEVKQLKFGNYSLEQYTKVTGADIGTVKEITEDYTQLDMIADIVFCGLFGSYRANKKVVDFTVEDVQSWVDNINYVDQLKVIREFMACIVVLTEQMVDAMKAMSAEDSNGEKKK